MNRYQPLAARQFMGAAVARYGQHFALQSVNCGRAERNDGARRHEFEFLQQPPAVVLYFSRRGRLMQPLLTPPGEFEMLDGVRHVAGLAIDAASSSALSSRRPDGPTKGRPSISSRSPGCSPTRQSWGLIGPSPNTAFGLPENGGGAEAIIRFSSASDLGSRASRLAVKSSFMVHRPARHAPRVPASPIERSSNRISS